MTGQLHIIEAESSASTSMKRPTPAKPYNILDDEPPVPGLSSGSEISAKVKRFKKHASELEYLRNNRYISKFAIGASQKKETRTFHLYISRGRNRPLTV